MFDAHRQLIDAMVAPIVPNTESARGTKRFKTYWLAIATIFKIVAFVGC